MTLSRRKFSAEFKVQAVRHVEAGASTAAVARRYEIHPTLLTKWRKQLRQDPERAFSSNRNGSDEEARIAEFDRLISAGNYEQAGDRLESYLVENPRSWEGLYQLLSLAK